MKLPGLYFLLLLSWTLASCRIENLDGVTNIPKTDFSNYNYVLATEDASDEDITTFFAFSRTNIDPEEKYDLISRDALFINANPSVSSGNLSLGRYFFSLAKDKKGYSSTPGLYRLTLNNHNRAYIDQELHISRDNLFPARQLCIANDSLGYFYDEGKAAQHIQVFDPEEMVLQGSVDLKPAISKFRPDAKWTDEAGNNLVRTGSLVIAANQGKLYVSVVFLEKAGFNLIAEEEENFYLAVIDMKTREVEKIIAFKGAKTVGFFVSENKATTVDEAGNMYFCSWGWNQFNAHNPSKIFRIRSGDTDFDRDWEIDIEKCFGARQIAQSIISYNNKIYLHISDQPYTFSDSDDDPAALKMSYYEFDPRHPEEPRRLDIPSSNTSPRMNVFSLADDKLFVAVPNKEDGKFNGFYSVDREGKVEKELTVENKYRPTRLYKLQN